jgi:hypothetical protein
MNMRLHLLRVLRATVYCFNIHTLVLCAISCTSCFIAEYMNWSYRLEFSLMALGITIPLTFNITQASSSRADVALEGSNNIDSRAIKRSKGLAACLVLH